MWKTEKHESMYSGEYIYPPRPEKAIPIQLTSMYAKRNWIAQVKKNGTATVVIVLPDGEIDVWTRHHDRHKMWSPSDRIRTVFRKLVGSYNVFAAELLHSKVTGGPRDTLYIFDAMVIKGQSLVGVTQEERMRMVRDLFECIGEKFSHTVVSDGVWIAKDLTIPYSEVMKNLSVEDEGIVLKDPKSKLEPGFKPRSNEVWQVKSRIKTKNYSF